MRARIIKIAVVAVIALILLWRFWPHPISKLMSEDIENASKAMATVSISDIKNGKPKIDVYTMNEVTQDQLTEVIGILDTSKYRRDWRNLVSWALVSLSGGKKYDGRSVQIYIYFPTTENEYGRDIDIWFSGGQMVIYDINRSRAIYRPTNHETLNYLVGYLQANGVLQ